jgi:hypothetical protein
LDTLAFTKGLITIFLVKNQYRTNHFHRLVYQTIRLLTTRSAFVMLVEFVQA